MKKPNHESIYLIPGSYDGEQCYVWSDDPAPGTEDNPEDAVKYVRADLFNALKAQVEQFLAAINKKYPSDECKHLDVYLNGIADAARKTPAQCLAEVKAQAVEDFADELVEIHNFHPYTKSIIYAKECANQIRQSAKAGS